MERYAVFGMFVDGSPLFLGSTDGLTEAEAAMLNAASRTALEHFVYDFRLEALRALRLRGAGSGQDSPQAH